MVANYSYTGNGIEWNGNYIVVNKEMNVFVNIIQYKVINKRAFI